MKTISIIPVIRVLSWIVFLGLCIKAGAVLFTFTISLYNPPYAADLYQGLDLSILYSASRLDYIFLMAFAIILSSMQAFIFYFVVSIFEKLNLVRPFSEEIFLLISKISYFSLATGGIGLLAHQFADQLVKNGLVIGKAIDFWEGRDAFLFMGGVVLVIAQIFRRGIDLQVEHDLTV
ncbi:DUF2975 domain-containing protein [Sphingobacterium griseoflavum]|uniref:DUF2975 domain-containing protein n=1 Tax=Sphingobacterium griseoflavum TaxID=1474952 RepID=A0ABQ3HYB8_9SPHI|nr:DUF2975 domain-containing protein [Sphingobacterium griseoflavum]GHE36635.1 hypothetical protein GCM10017764_19720 [Sphingobacterium griseoflavum]